MKKIKLYISVAFIGSCIGVGLSSCTGRTADNMTPLGETVRVVIPETDVAQDSAVALGQTDSLTVVNQ